MSEIKAGDVVVVARLADCGCGPDIGHITTVGRITIEPYTECRICGTLFHNETNLYAYEPSGGPICSLRRLKKIPPLDQLEGQKDSSGLDERHEFYEALRKMAEGLRS